MRPEGPGMIQEETLVCSVIILSLLLIHIHLLTVNDMAVTCARRLRVGANFHWLPKQSAKSRKGEGNRIC